MRAVPVFVAVLLALSSPALAAVASGPAVDASVDGPSERVTNATVVEPVEAVGTTNRLTLDGQQRRSFGSSSSDLGSTLSGQDEALRSEYDSFLIDARFQELSNAEKNRYLQQELERLQHRIDAIAERERTAVERHANGALDDDALLRMFVRNHREATELERHLGVLDERADETGYSLLSHEYRVQLEAFQSPVRERLERTMNGFSRADGSPEIAYVESAETGFVLSTIDNGRYVRETVRYDNRDLNRSDQINGEYQDRFNELYPWIFDETRKNSVSPTYTPHNRLQLYKVSVDHPQGELVAHLDGGSGEIFREVQRLPVDQLPTERSGTWRSPDLSLSINETPAHGPINVSVSDAETGEPVDATIQIDETTIGDTGRDGSLWLIPPSREYEVTARSGGASINATVDGSD